MIGNTRYDIVEELIQRGYPHDSPADVRRLQMIADGYIALTETLALGHLSGRYPDMEEIVDMLVLFTHGPRDYRTTWQTDQGSGRAADPE
jgi:hypothetical protein